MKKRPENKVVIPKAVAELFTSAEIPYVPVLLNKSRLHDSIAVVTGSIVMAGQHMRESVAEVNAAFSVKSRVRSKYDLSGFKIRQKAVRKKNDRTWKRC